MLHQNNQITHKDMATTLTIGSQVQSTQFGLGTIVSIDGTNAVVNFNGIDKKLMTAFLKAAKASKIKAYMKEEAAEVYTFKMIVNNLKGDRQSRMTGLFVGECIFNKIEKTADAQGHFAARIIEDARNGKTISEKQACVVAYFAQANGFLNN